MRIAVVSGNRELVGGAEAYVRWLFAALIARGHEVAAAFVRDAGSPERAIDGAVDGARRWALAELGEATWKRRLLEFEPQVAYVHGVEAPGLEAWVARRFDSVLYAHAFHGACATGTRRFTLPALRVCERSFGPACLAVNYARGCGARRPDRLLKAYSEQRERAALLSTYRALTVASHYVRDTYVRQGLPREKVRLLPYPTLDWPAQALPPEPRAFSNRVLFVGRITALKGLDHAVRALALAKRWLGRALTLVVAGEGPELGAAVELARRLDVALEVSGWVDAEVKRRLYAGADVLLVPSLWPEPFGIVGIEAGALGCPAVAYASGGIKDWLEPGRSGEAAPAECFEAEELAAALVRALRESEHHQQLRLGAWQIARRHSPAAHVEELERVFSDVSSRADAPSVAAPVGA